MNVRDLSTGSKLRGVLRLGLAAFAFALGSTTVNATPCGGFTDADSTNPAVSGDFCASVEWVKNRQVTLGCTSSTQYCPFLPVSRIAMAAFMNRLGTALTPLQLMRDDAPGAIDLDAATAVVCQTTDFKVENYPRTAYADASLSATSAADVTFAADLAFSIDAGATWTNLNTNPNRGSTLAPGWGNASDVGTRELAVGQVARFGIKMSRGFVGGSADITDSRCLLRVLIYSRTGSSSPF